MNRIATFTIATTLAFNTFAAGARYSLSDLEILSNQRSFKEFFQHAKDIKPTNRKKKWKSMVSDMGEQFAISMAAQSFNHPKNYKLLMTISKWPTLRSNSYFGELRDKNTVIHFDRCYRTTSFGRCQTELQSYLQSFNTKTDYQFKLLQSYYEQLPMEERYTDKVVSLLAEPIITNKLGEFYCSKSPLKEILDIKLKLNLTKRGNKVNLYNIAHPDCVGSLSKYYTSKLDPTNNIHEQEIAYQILGQTHMLTKFQKFRFHVLYILQNSSPGETFNLAWNSLEKLSKNHKWRDKVYADLKKMDPLPGKIFSKTPDKRNTLIVKHFGRHFPEYIDHYSRTCIQYYKGTKNFEAGNPTVECADFMKSASKHSLIPKSIIDSYKEAVKI